MENRENLIGIIATIYQWRKPIIRVVLVSLVLSIIGSLLLPNYYSSTTAFYAASTDLAKPELIYGSVGRAMEYYGGDPDIDRLLTIAESYELKNFLVDSFDLFKRYDIDSSESKSRFKVMETLDELYDVKKTKYDAIQLTVEDKDRILAAKMVNAARNRINEIAIGLIKTNQKQLLHAFEVGMAQKQSELHELDDSLIHSRSKYGIYNVDAQGEYIGNMVAKKENALIGSKGRLKSYEGLANANPDTVSNIKAAISGVEDELDRLTSRNSPSSFTLDKFNNGVSKVEILMQLHEQSRKRLGYDLERYNQLYNAYRSDFTSLILVETGQVPIVKTRPKRMILVLACTLVSIFLTLIGVLLIQNYRAIDWKEALNA